MCCKQDVFNILVNIKDILKSREVIRRFLLRLLRFSEIKADKFRYTFLPDLLLGIAFLGLRLA